jgi:hypothetical protein
LTNPHTDRIGSALGLSPAEVRLLAESLRHERERGRAEGTATALKAFATLNGTTGAVRDTVRKALPADEFALPDGEQHKAFEESKHPRDHGKFSSKPGADGGGEEGAAPEKAAPAEKKPKSKQTKPGKATRRAREIIETVKELVIDRRGLLSDRDRVNLKDHLAERPPEVLAVVAHELGLLSSDPADMVEELASGPANEAILEELHSAVDDVVTTLDDLDNDTKGNYSEVSKNNIREYLAKRSSDVLDLVADYYGVPRGSADDVITAYLANVTAPREEHKAWDESKVARDHGKFSSHPGAPASHTPAHERRDPARHRRRAHPGAGRGAPRGRQAVPRRHFAPAHPDGAR